MCRPEQSSGRRGGARRIYRASCAQSRTHPTRPTTRFESTRCNPFREWPCACCTTQARRWPKNEGSHRNRSCGRKRPKVLTAQPSLTAHQYHRLLNLVTNFLDKFWAFRHNMEVVICGLGASSKNPETPACSGKRVEFTRLS